MTKGFRIKPQKLLDVADDIKRLIEDSDGTHGAVAGTKPHFDQYGTQAALLKGLNQLSGTGDGSAAMAGAYGEEFKGMKTTYDNMIQQLKNLEQACRSTAQQYLQSDQQNQSIFTNAPLED